ncbi:MAG: EamA family transporter [Chitinophagaceae bacterium]|nr:EamA family transporter [Chitinophagaceae bacterium]
MHLFFVNNSCNEGIPATEKAKGYMALAITSTVWGTTWIASKIAIDEIPALQMAAIRQLIAGVIFILFLWDIKNSHFLLFPNWPG